MIKAIAMDMDGTLLTQDNQILPTTKKLLVRLQQQGIRLILASGRSYTKLLPYAKELQMDQFGGYLVEVNGTAVYEVSSGKREVLAQITLDQVHDIFHYFMQYQVEIIGNLDDGMYDYIPADIMEEKRLYRLQHQLAQDVPWSAGAFDLIYDNRKGYPRLFYIQEPEEIKESLNKISVAYHPEVILQVAKQAKEDLSDTYWIGLTSDRWLEVMPLGVTKASGLAHVARIAGISLSDMMAFGDGENDIAMLREVGLGVAMGNAFSIVKDIADDVTLTNQEEGIAYYLKNYFKL